VENTIESFLHELGSTAYHAYGEVVQWRDVRGELMPEWEVLSERVQSAWAGAAQGILLKIADWPTQDFADAIVAVVVSNE
jgi:hypothetical protein